MVFKNDKINDKISDKINDKIKPLGGMS